MKIIINADDLGQSVDVNEKIFALFDKQKITSATLMANGNGFLDAVERIKQIENNPNISIGIHLNISEFSSLTKADIFYETGLTDEKGCFLSTVRNIRPSKSLKNAILEEWKQQVNKIRDHGIQISHIDSHDHTHTVPWLFLTLKKMQVEAGIEKVRLTRNMYSGKALPVLFLRKYLWNFAVKNYHKTQTTDLFTDFSCFYERAIKGQKFKAESIELMCHPGNSGVYAEENELVGSEWVPQLPFPIKLISYKQL